MEIFLALLRSFGYAAAKALPAIDEPATNPPDVSRVLLLFGPGHRPIALDAEARLSETGVAAIQIADYRNFGHGRHLGLARNLADTAVVAVAESNSDRLATSTVAALPETAQVTWIRSPLDWPNSVPDLLVGSSRLAGTLAARQGLDPANPRVPTFGRRLYRLRASKLLDEDTGSPVAKKLAAAGLPRYGLQRDIFEASYKQWRRGFDTLRVDGVVLDYDGTTCDTEGRFDNPMPRVQQQIKRLLASGRYLAFASGRGQSIWTGLRGWIPKSRWERVMICVYNGGHMQSLSEPFEVPAVGSEAIDEMHRRLMATSFASLYHLDARQVQLSVTPLSGSTIGISAIRTLAEDLRVHTPELSLRIVQSGHSVDIVPASASKTVAVTELERGVRGPVVAIGDQGQLGGNDYSLLAATKWSLSVDRVSGDPTRCWNIATGFSRGPAALVEYLELIAERRV